MTGAVAAAQGQIVTFGIQPTRAETGYAWLEAGQETHPGVNALERFIEKPDAAKAETLFADDRYLWNAGLFLARADTVVAAFEAHAPDIFEATRAAMDAAEPDLGFLRIDPTLWSQVRSESIDYAVMEQAQNVSVVRFTGGWSDLGSWEAVWQESPQDRSSNAVAGLSTAIDCENKLLRSESDEIELVGIGLKNVVAVAMRDAVLVADMSDSQSVCRAVDMLKARGAKQAVQLPVDYRPWGWFETKRCSDRTFLIAA